MDEQQNGGSTPVGAPSPDMLSALLSNPDLIRRVGSIIGAMQNAGGQSAPSAEASSIPEEGDPAETEPTSANGNAAPSSGVGGGIPDGLATVLSDPAMLEKLPGIMAAMKPLLSSMPPPQQKHDSKPRSPEDCRDNLLLALKPFLSPERRDAVDSILRIAKLGTVFKQLT